MRTLLAILLLALLVLGGPTPPTHADGPKKAWPWPYASGASTPKINGLGTTLYVPRTLTPNADASLLIVLHGARAKASRLVTFFRYWPTKNYVVCAPQARGPVWTPADLQRVRGIVKTLQAKLPISSDKLHVAGFSNGASNLYAIAFAEDMKARSGTWVGGGLSRTVPIPAWAKTRFGALLMAGENDGALRYVRQSVPLLRGKVRSVEFHVEPDIGHTWPSSQLEYHLWWMGVQEGRFEPGADMNFDWYDDLAEALDEVKQGEAKGVLFYLYDSEADKTSAAARALQQGTFMDPGVRRLGRRLLAVRVDKRGNTAALAKLGVPAMATPAVMVFGRDGRPVKTLSGQIEIKPLREALGLVLR